jgi:hypothetical protein
MQNQYGFQIYKELIMTINSMYKLKQKNYNIIPKNLDENYYFKYPDFSTF